MEWAEKTGFTSVIFCSFTVALAQESQIKEVGTVFYIDSVWLQYTIWFHLPTVKSRDNKKKKKNKFYLILVSNWKSLDNLDLPKRNHKEFPLKSKEELT